MNSQSNGILTNTTPVLISAAGLSCPFTVCLLSSAAGRKIELSADDGTNWITPTPDATSTASMQIVTINAPVMKLRLTGQAADKWFINASGAS